MPRVDAVARTVRGLLNVMALSCLTILPSQMHDQPIVNQAVANAAQTTLAITGSQFNKTPLTVSLGARH